MAAKGKAPTELYNVHSAVSGAQVIIGVPLGDASTPGTAVYERDRLNAEARRPNPSQPSEPTGMHHGVLTTYEVRSRAGVVVRGN